MKPEYLYYVLLAIIVTLTIIVFIVEYVKKKGQKRQNFERQQRLKEERATDEQEKIIAACCKEIQSNLLQYINGCNINICDETLVFEECDNGNVCCVWNGIGITVGFSAVDGIDCLMFRLDIGNYVCCLDSIYNDINYICGIVNEALEENKLKNRITDFEVGDNSIFAVSVANFPILIRNELYEIEHFEYDCRLLTSTAVNKMMSVIEDIFKISTFNGLAKKTRLIMSLANVLVLQLNSVESTEKTNFGFEANPKYYGFSLVGCSIKEDSWIRFLFFDINIFEKELSLIFGPIIFMNEKTKIQLEKIEEEYNNASNGRIRAFCRDDGLFLGCVLNSFVFTDNGTEIITALYKEFIDRSESIREFFKERD